MPKFVYYPLSKWYNSDRQITRQVIHYRAARRNTFNDAQSMMSSHSMKFMQSSQKFYNPAQEDFEDELHKKVGDIVYELEVNPNLIYLGLVADSGERTYRQAVSNGRLDLNYVKRVLKMQRVPFEEIEVSRKTTLHSILNMAAKTYKKNIKRGRLLIEDQVIAGTHLFKTLED